MANTKNQKRLEKLLSLISTSAGKTKVEIANELDMSIPTVSRDLKAIRDRNHEISCIDGKYILAKIAPSANLKSKYSIVENRLVNILWFISDKGKCSSKSLHDFFTYKNRDIANKDSKVCKKSMDNYLKRLLAEGLIIKEITEDGKLFYSIAGGKSDKGVPVDLGIALIKFIKGNKAPLPFNASLDIIADKLENGVIKSLSGNSFYLNREIHQKDAFNQIGVAYKTFTSGIDNNLAENNDKLISDLELLCSKNTFVEIWLKESEKPLRHFCLFVACHISLGRWYLVVKSHKNTRGFSLIRVDKIDKINEISDIQHTDEMIKKIQDIKQSAYVEIIESFGMGLGGKVRIKLKIDAEKETLDCIILRLENFILHDETQQNYDESLNITVEIDGVPDFLHWIRGFGSNVIIKEPDYIRKLQYDGTMKMLETYKEAFHGKEL